MNFLTCNGLRELSTATLALAHPSFGIFTGLTMTSMTGGWYHRVSPTEALLIGMLILQVFVLRYLQILPLDLNQSFHDGFLAGRRKRRNTSKTTGQSDILTTTLLTILRRLDFYDCVPLFLCEAHPLTKHRPTRNNLPKQTLRILEALQRFGREERECYDEQVWTRNGSLAENQRPAIAELEEAMMLQEQKCKPGTNPVLTNSSFHEQKSCKCSARYSGCPLTSDEIFQLVSISSDE